MLHSLGDKYSYAICILCLTNTGFHATHYLDHDPESVECDDDIFDLDSDGDDTAEPSESYLNTTSTKNQQLPVACHHLATDDVDARDHLVRCGDADGGDNSNDDVIESAKTTDYYLTFSDESVTSGQRSMQWNSSSCRTLSVLLAFISIILTATPNGVSLSRCPTQRATYSLRAAQPSTMRK